MPTLFDTNILLRSIQQSHPMHPVAVRSLEALLAKGEPLYLAIQNVAEFWNATTRPVSANGLGYSHEKAREEIDRRLEGFFEILSESAAASAAWKELVTTAGVSGAQVHDECLVAVMKVHGITRIMAFNVQDFKRFGGAGVPALALIQAHP